MNKFLMMIMTMFLMFGTLSIPVFAEGEADTVTTDTTTESTSTEVTTAVPSGKYIGYSKLEYNLHTMNYIFDGNEERVAYCMNADKSTPVPIINADQSHSLDDYNYHYMTYTKGDASTIDAEVKRVLYYGYPIDGKVESTSENPIDQLQLSPIQYRIATQAAVWKYTDGLDYKGSMSKILAKVGGGEPSGEVIEAYNTEAVENAYNLLVNTKLLPAVENVELEYYKNDSEFAQDLLVAKINTADTFKPSLFNVTISAQKLLDEAIPGESDKFTFVLKNGDKVIQEVQNDGSSVVFSFCQYTTDTITYTVQEKVGDDATIVYDDSVYEVTVSYVNGKTDVESGITFQNYTKQPEPTTPEPEITVAKEPEPTQAPEPTVAPVKEEVKEEVVAEAPVVEETVVATRPYTPNTGDDMEVVKWSKTFTTALALGILNGIILKKYH